GRLTVPLAKIAKAVTVVEPSKGMLEALKENARMSGVHNIRYVNKRWEDVEVGGEVEEHDVVVASFSLLVFDLKAALEKIDSAARKAAYIFFSAESWIPEDLQGLLFGEAFGMLSDHIIAYNLLHSIGITPNVEVIEYEMRKCFNTFDEALRDFAESYAVPSSKARVLEGYLKNALVEESDGLWYKRRRKAALIWWTK
ncbi:MAG: class I SAM-dependent methyltransferase, partial [Thermoproteota archaeon]